MRCMDARIRWMSFGLKLGAILFPAFFVLDYVCYPEYKLELLSIRLCISAYLLFFLFLINRIDQKYFLPIIFMVALPSAFSLSLMCFITGDGFASPYCLAILQVVIIGALFSAIKPKYYITIICGIVAQHFILLSFIPWNLKSFAANAFGIGVFSAICALLHSYIYKSANEIRMLKGIIPICSSCKKIRDDKGHWHKIESYISANSEAEFSHGMCPECIRKLFPEFTDGNKYPV